MAYIEIYFKSWCPYSQRALALLARKGVNFTAIDLTNDANDLEEEMHERSGRTSVPQVFINGEHIGGYDDIAALDSVDELDPLLFSGDASNAA